MENQQSQEDALIHNLDQITALIDYVRLAGLNELNEYQKDKMLNLTTRQGIVITTVSRITKQTGPGVTLSHLARELHMSVSATSHLIDTLEAHNLLTRTADEGDRRSVRIHLSASGQKCAALARQGMMKAIRRLTSRLSEEENARRMRMIDKIYHLAYPEKE